MARQRQQEPTRAEEPTISGRYFAAAGGFLDTNTLAIRVDTVASVQRSWELVKSGEEIERGSHDVTSAVHRPLWTGEEMEALVKAGKYRELSMSEVSAMKETARTNAREAASQKAQDSPQAPAEGQTDSTLTGTIPAPENAAEAGGA